MRVVIDGRFLGQTTTGVQRYATEVVRGFDRLLSETPQWRDRYDIVVAVPSGTPGLCDLTQVRFESVGRMQGHPWEQIELDHFAGDDLLLCLCNVGPLRRRKQVVTLHDASVFAQPSAYSYSFRAWYGLVQRQIGTRARMILTDSDFSRRELQHYLRVPERRVRVVPLGSDHLERVAADESILPRYQLGQRPFVLAVSSLAPHKNLGTMVQSVGRIRRHHADLDIVLAGARFDRVFGAGLLPDSGAIEVGYVSDAELKALYQNAACFVYPSLYEGFGLPPLEAMACGCPVVLSSAGSLPEVGGEAVLYFDPHDAAALAEAVARVLDDPGLAQQLCRKGRARAAELTWDRCARRTFAVVEEAIAG